VGQQGAKAPPSPPSNQQPPPRKQQQLPPSKQQQLPPSKQQQNKSKQPQQRGAIPLSPTAAVAASEALADDEENMVAGASTPRDRKRDRFRRFVSGLLRLPSGSRSDSGGSSTRPRGGRNALKQLELARGLGLTEAETMGAGTARGFGNIGMAPDLGGPVRLRPLGKRERAR
jgi:hypothetical protein